MLGIVVPAVAVAGVAVVVAIVLVPLLARMAPAWGLLDQPGGRRRHERAVPLVGGLAVVVASLIALGVGAVWWRHFQGFSWWFLLGVVLMLWAGVLDDLFELPHWLKGALQIAAILPLIFLAGAKVTTLGDLVGGGAVTLGASAIPFTLICLLGYINAANMIDGLDGLAGGVAAVALVFLAAIAGVHGLSALFLVALAFLAATLTFLVYNLRTPWRSHAAVFLGDAGSMALGLAVGGIAVVIAGKPGYGTVSPMGIAWILALPVMDTLVVMTRRLASRRSPFTADRLHLHHVLVDLGLAPGRATAALLALAALYGLYGLLATLAGVPEWVSFVSFLGVLGLHALLVLLAHRRACSPSMGGMHPHPDSAG